MKFSHRRSKMAVEHLALNVTPDQDPKALRPKIFSGILDHLTDRGETLLDLGAGGCAFSIFACDLGYRVTAVDARTRAASGRARID